MRKALIILIVFFGIFLAIGCTGNKGGNQTGGGGASETGTPVIEVTPGTAVNGDINQSGNMAGNITGNTTDNQTRMDGNVSGGGTKPVLMDFSATWCGPCRMQKPILEELEKKYGDKVEFKVVDVDENPQLASQYEINAVPTLIILKDGVEVKRFIGSYRGKRTIIGTRYNSLILCFYDRTAPDSRNPRPIFSEPCDIF